MAKLTAKTARIPKASERRGPDSDFVARMRIHLAQTREEFRKLRAQADEISDERLREATLSAGRHPG